MSLFYIRAVYPCGTVEYVRNGPRPGYGNRSEFGDYEDALKVMEGLAQCDDQIKFSIRRVSDDEEPQTGLDDGPYLPGKAPRKQPAKKTPEELRAIRAKAWGTRRKAKSSPLPLTDKEPQS